MENRETLYNSLKKGNEYVDKKQWTGLFFFTKDL